MLSSSMLLPGKLLVCPLHQLSQRQPFHQQLYCLQLRSVQLQPSPGHPCVFSQSLLLLFPLRPSSQSRPFLQPPSLQLQPSLGHPYAFSQYQLLLFPLRLFSRQLPFLQLALQPQPWPYLLRPSWRAALERRPLLFHLQPSSDQQLPSSRLRLLPSPHQPFFSPHLQQPVLPTMRDAYQHLGAKLAYREIAWDRIFSVDLRLEILAILGHSNSLLDLDLLD